MTTRQSTTTQCEVTRWVRGYNETRRDATRHNYNDTTQETAMTRHGPGDTTGESEMERGSLVLEEMGLNNQHEVGGEGWWRENGEDDD